LEAYQVPMKQKISVGTAISENIILPNDANHYNTIFGGTLLNRRPYFTFVNVDKKGNPVSVMQPEFEAAEEKNSFERRRHEKEYRTQERSICLKLD